MRIIIKLEGVSKEIVLDNDGYAKLRGYDKMTHLLEQYCMSMDKGDVLVKYELKEVANGNIISD